MAAGQTFPTDAIYYISSRDGHYRIYATDLNHQITRKLHNQPAGNEIALSPDGSRIAFTGWNQRTPTLFIMDWNGKHVTAITQSASQRISHPLWSPDSRQLAFTAYNNRRVEIHVMQADGSGQRALPIEQSEVDKELLAWSPDGQRIAFRNRNYLHAAVQVIAVDGNQPALAVTDALAATWAQWSPDGRRVAYVTASRLTNTREVYMQDAACFQSASQHPCSLTPLNINETAIGFYDQALWSPDNRYLLLYSGRTRLPGNHHIYVADIDSQEWRRLTNNNDEEFMPAWSPSGQHVAYVTDGLIGSPKLYIAALDGHAAPIRNDIYSYYSPEWWPG